MEKHIILLNGSSSSGKSTLAKVLQTVIEDKRNERGCKKTAIKKCYGDAEG